MSVQFKTGAVTGTGSNIDVVGEKLGFKPSKVVVYNKADQVKATWQDTFGDGEALVEYTNDGTSAHVTSGGITPSANGFTIGTCDVNSPGNVLHYEAIG